MNQYKEKAREEVKAILRILPTITNKELRAHLLEEKRKLESVIALHEIREQEAREATRAIKEAKAGDPRETRLIIASEQR